MDALAAYHPVELTPVQVNELQDRLTAANRILRSASGVLYGSHRKELRLRDEYKRGQIKLAMMPQAVNALKELAGFESQVLSGFIKVGAELCRAFYFANADNCGCTLDDYVQRAADAIYDATYTYDGRNMLSTYVYWVVKNRLIGYSRVENRHRRGDTKSIEDEGIIISAPKLDDTQEFQWEAIRTAPLDPLERTIIDAMMSGDDDWQKKFLATYISPHTGTHISRSRLHQLFQRAQEKIVSQYTRLAA